MIKTTFNPKPLLTSIDGKLDPTAGTPAFATDLIVNSLATPAFTNQPVGGSLAVTVTNNSGAYVRVVTTRGNQTVPPNLAILMEVESHDLRITVTDVQIATATLFDTGDVLTINYYTR